MIFQVWIFKLCDICCDQWKMRRYMVRFVWNFYVLYHLSRSCMEWSGRWELKDESNYDWFYGRENLLCSGRNLSESMLYVYPKTLTECLPWRRSLTDECETWGVTGYESISFVLSRQTWRSFTEWYCQQLLSLWWLYPWPCGSCPWIK